MLPEVLGTGLTYRPLFPSLMLKNTAAQLPSIIQGDMTLHMGIGP